MRWKSALKALVDQHRRNDGEFLPAGYAFKSLPGHFVSPTAHQYKDFALLNQSQGEMLSNIG